MATGMVIDAVKAVQDEKKQEGEEPVLQLKDFVWDQFLKYISSAILALTVLNVSVEFLRGGGVLCFPPPLTIKVSSDFSGSGGDLDELQNEFSLRQVDYLNGYCSRSIPHSEFFPLYILVHGILLIAPHFVWGAVFKGDFDSFFAVTRKLDRLRDRNTGEYSSQNFDRVEKLELEFGGKRRKIFLLYIGKLLLQFAVCIGSYVFSIAFFINFSFAFDCPQDFSQDNIPDKWPLNTTIPCVYTTLRVLSLVRYADYILLALAIVLILLGLFWCVVRHTKELGHKDIANFVFQSCLSTKTFVFPPFYEIRSSQYRSDNCWFCCFPLNLLRPGNRGCIACQVQFMLFSPRIRNDLDFFEMYLFRADTSHGRVFKEIQIDKELRKLQGEDHQLLHLFLDAQRDMNAQIRDREIKQSQMRIERQQTQSNEESPGVPRTEEVAEGNSPQEITERSQSTSSDGGNAEDEDETEDPLLSRVQDLNAFFKMGPGGFSRNPEKLAFVHLQKYLSNIKWRPVEGIRDRLYGFVMYSPKHEKGEQAGEPKTEMALDISFGSSGYALVLARAFKKVISVNFHPFFRNEKEPVKKKAFYTNYVDVNMPEDIYTQENTNINEAADKMFEHMRKPYKRPADFLVIGPLREDSKIVTVTLTIEMLHTVKLIEEGAILLAVRPLKIGHRNMTEVFCKYEPPTELFDHKFHKETVLNDLKEQIGNEEVNVNGFPGIRVKCGDTLCIFEFVTYKYKGKRNKEEDDKVTGVIEEPSQPDNEAHPEAIERSQSMPPYSYMAQQSYDPSYQQHYHAQSWGYPTQHPPYPIVGGPPSHNIVGPSRIRPGLMRSHTIAGPTPEFSDSNRSVFSPPGLDVRNNENQFYRKEVQFENKNGRGLDGGLMGRGARGRSWRRGPSRGGIGGIEGRNGIPRERHSSSSGIMSPPFDPLSEEDTSSRSNSFEQKD